MTNFPNTRYPHFSINEELYRFGADGNLRLYSYDRLFYSLYGYDGGTARTYKYSFDLSPQWVNGRLEAVNFNLHNAMFYPNAYINFNNNGYYTKHYYNGMERIASRLGDQNLPINVNDPDLQDRKDWQDSLIRKQITEITGYEFLPVGEEQNHEDPKPVFELPVIGLNNLQPSADGIFYYHPNHLGSTCYVTDGNASVQQGFLYAPFGEITNEHSPMWQNGNIPKYAFNAKELDEETGMYYYEARYYQPPTFTSRDPLFEKYPTVSPYAYCANNPVKYVDPDGREKLIFFDTKKHKYSNYTQWKQNNKQRIKNYNLQKSAQQYKDHDEVIHLFAHGTPSSVNLAEKGEKNNPYELMVFLSNHSVTYQKNSIENKKSLLIMHSCETGKGENSIAQQLSEYAGSDMLIIAPSETVSLGGNVEKVNENGVWNVYYKGKIVGKYKGDIDFQKQLEGKNIQNVIRYWTKKYEEQYDNK